MVAGIAVVQGGLVVFDREEVIGTLAHDLLCNRGLATHSVEGHDRTTDLQQAQQLGDRGDLVGFLRGGHLP